MGPLSLWVSALLVPSGLWFLNVVLRLGAKRELTAGADWLLLLVVFDVTTAVNINDFRGFVRYEPFRTDLGGVLAVLGILCGIGWAITVSYLEPWALSRSTHPSDRARATRTLREALRDPISLIRWASFCLTIALLFMVTAGHILAFFWTGWDSFLQGLGLSAHG